jgi:hypothetical protein
MPFIHSLTRVSTLVFDEAPRDIGLVQDLANHGFLETAKFTLVLFLQWQRLSP